MIAIDDERTVSVRESKEYVSACYSGGTSRTRAEKVHTIVQRFGIPPPIWRPQLGHSRAILRCQHLSSTVRVDSYPTPEQRRVSRSDESLHPVIALFPLSTPSTSLTKIRLVQDYFNQPFVHFSAIHLHSSAHANVYEYRQFHPHQICKRYRPIAFCTFTVPKSITRFRRMREIQLRV
jgi:hypothetical protein